MVGCAVAEGSAAGWLSSPSPSPLSPSSGSGMYSMQSTGAASGKDLTVRGEGRFKEKISTWPPAPSCLPPTWHRDPERLSGGTTDQRWSSAPAPPGTYPKRLLATESWGGALPILSTYILLSLKVTYLQLPWQQA